MKLLYSNDFLIVRKLKIKNKDIIISHFLMSNSQFSSLINSAECTKINNVAFFHKLNSFFYPKKINSNLFMLVKSLCNECINVNKRDISENVLKSCFNNNSKEYQWHIKN